MPRGRQYYDPIVQVPSTVENPDDVSRIELFPEVVGDVITRWCARRISADGMHAEDISGSADHDEVLHRAQQTWPGLEVYELKSETEDSTHEGMGPSPRLWQTTSVLAPLLGVDDVPPAHEESSAELHAIYVQKNGTYVNLEDLLVALETYAVQYDEQGNPSGALALREAAAALREPF
jgi:hypothetical protein